MVQIEPMVSVSSTMVWWAFKYAITPSVDDRNIICTVDIVENILAVWDKISLQMRLKMVSSIETVIRDDPWHEDIHELHRVLDRHYHRG